MVKKELTFAEKMDVLSWSRHADIFSLNESEFNFDLENAGMTSEKEKILAWAGIEFEDNSLKPIPELLEKLDTAFWAEDENGLCVKFN